MSVPAAYDGPPPAGLPRRSRTLSWCTAVVVLMLAFGWFVAKPVIQSVATSLNVAASAALSTALQTIAAAVKIPFDMARQRVQESAEVKAMLGEPIQCAALEETEWMNAGASHELEFKFKITGPKGGGEVYAIATAADTSFELTRLEVTGPDGRLVELPNP